MNISFLDASFLRKKSAQVHMWTNASLPCLIVATDVLLSLTKIYYFTHLRAWQYVTITFIISLQEMGKTREAFLLIKSAYLSPDYWRVGIVFHLQDDALHKTCLLEA